MNSTLLLSTVVLISGLTTSPESWSVVEQTISRDATTIVVSRPDQLEAALKSSAAKPPYVLVGHSYGAIAARLFAIEHPELVAGMVLVDPSHEDMSRVTALLPREVIDAHGEMTKPLPTGGIDIEAGFRELRAAKWKPAFPLVVIEAGRDESEANAIWTEERLRQRAAILREMNEKLAATSPKGKFVVAKNAGHFIQEDAPYVVTDAIQWVLERSASSKTPARRSPASPVRP